MAAPPIEAVVLADKSDSATTLSRNVATPETSRVLPNVAAPVTFTVLSNTVAPDTSNVLANFAAPWSDKSWFIDTSPLSLTLILSTPAVKKRNSLLLSPAAVSAVILVSWSTSITPPREPQACPAPKPSNWSVVVL